MLGGPCGAETLPMRLAHRGQKDRGGEDAEQAGSSRPDFAGRLGHGLAAVGERRDRATKIASS